MKNQKAEGRRQKAKSRKQKAEGRSRSGDTTILPDVNLLVYAYNRDARRHAAARAWWEGLLTSAEPVALP